MAVKESADHDVEDRMVSGKRKLIKKLHVSEMDSQ
jgi:hypothetical protein